MLQQVTANVRAGMTLLLRGARNADLVGTRMAAALRERSPAQRPAGAILQGLLVAVGEARLGGQRLIDTFEVE